MSVFISWSGSRSKGVALELRQWLPNVLQAADIWMSDADIDAGSRGINEVFEQLEKATFGIIVVTPGNREAPWLLFEAGALSKRLSDKNRVCPYLLGMAPTDISKPLAEFQGVTANLDGTLRLVKSINNSFSPHLLKDDVLYKTFDRWWPDLERPINEWLSKAKTPPNQITEREILTEILGSVREISRRLDQNSQTQIPVDLNQIYRALSFLSPEEKSSNPLVRDLLRQREILRWSGRGRDFDEDSSSTLGNTGG